MKIHTKSTCNCKPVDELFDQLAGKFLSFDESNQIVEQELLESLKNGSEQEILCGLKRLNFMSPEMLSIMIHLLEGDKSLNPTFRHRLKITSWTAGQPRKEWDFPDADRFLMRRYMELKESKVVPMPKRPIPKDRKNVKYNDEKFNRVRAFVSLGFEFRLSARKIRDKIVAYEKSQKHLAANPQLKNAKTK